jgi:hypothetical protein
VRHVTLQCPHVQWRAARTLEPASTVDLDGGCIRSGPAERGMQPMDEIHQRGRLEICLAICLARSLQASEFKPRAVRSPSKRVTEPIR